MDPGGERVWRVDFGQFLEKTPQLDGIFEQLPAGRALCNMIVDPASSGGIEHPVYVCRKHRFGFGTTHRDHLPSTISSGFIDPPFNERSQSR
jgi:hypothetical protein